MTLPIDHTKRCQISRKGKSLSLGAILAVGLLLGAPVQAQTADQEGTKSSPALTKQWVPMHTSLRPYTEKGLFLPLQVDPQFVKITRWSQSTSQSYHHKDANGEEQASLSLAMQGTLLAKGNGETMSIETMKTDTPEADTSLWTSYKAQMEETLKGFSSQETYSASGVTPKGVYYCKYAYRTANKITVVVVAIHKEQVNRITYSVPVKGAVSLKTAQADSVASLQQWVTEQEMAMNLLGIV